MQLHHPKSESLCQDSYPWTYSKSYLLLKSSDTYGDKRKLCFHNSGMSIHTRLKKARKAAGLTQDEVAKKFEITRTAVSLWESDGEKGTKPDIRKLQELAALYNTPIETLLGDDIAAQEKRKVLSEAIEYSTLTNEQRQILSLMSSLNKEERDALLKMVSVLAKRRAERRKENIGNDPERRLGADIPPDPHDTRLFDPEWTGEVEQTQERKKK